MRVCSIKARLDAANIPYTTESFMSNRFWGTRYVFKNRYYGKKAESLGLHVLHFQKRWFTEAF